MFTDTFKCWSIMTLTLIFAAFPYIISPAHKAYHMCLLFWALHCFISVFAMVGGFDLEE